MHSKWRHLYSGLVLAVMIEIFFYVITQQSILLQSTATMQTSEYRNYEPYASQRLKIKVEYPSDWTKNALGASGLSNLRGSVIFEPQESEEELQANIEKETPTFEITAEHLGFKNMTVDEYAKLQSENIQYLFSDFDFKIENKTALTIGNNTASKIVYTIVNPYAQDNFKIRNGMEIWTIRADTVYTLSYLGEQDQYLKYLPEVQKIIKSLEFID